MRSDLDCIPCFLRQALESVRMATQDEAVHEQVLREALSEVDRDVFFMLKVKCPVIARDIGCAVGEMVLRRKAPPRIAGQEGSQPR